ncbi:hypothetical protein CLV84_0339 [Neolewinella xylanilytica]|uniref:Uncharacterized protein n=1 Tax=Neolewinella xylanilytica TaxID=1514080 RepID=A0A2S6I7J4_9BACT|nr:hypothetical protein [Neolewinella xylanilytica]PPK87399.1 hypothetical protein CLV84_0339 [Neolewinella xylanilytica]
MKYCLLVGLLCSALTTCFSQQLTYRELYGNYAFSLDNQIYSLNEMIAEQPEGTELRWLLRSGRRNRIWGNSFGFTGAFLLGTALADALVDNDGEESLNHWATYVSAGVLIGVSFPMLSTADKRIEEAVGLFNSGPGTGYIPKRKRILYAGYTREGVGFGLRF